MFVSLPCGTDDPKERVEIIRSGTKGAKSEHNALGADVLLNWAEHATPNVFSAAARDLHPAAAGRPSPAHPLPVDLECAGARLPPLPGRGRDGGRLPSRSRDGRRRPQRDGHELPRGAQLGAHGLRRDRPGVAAIAAAIPEALDELRAAAGLVPSTPAGIAPGRSSRRRTTPARRPSAVSNGASPDVSSP